MKNIVAGVLNVSYRDIGPDGGPVVVLLHGFPYDIHAYDEVSARLVQAGWRCIVPYLRGYGPTRFLDSATPRSGEQAALGADLLALLDALHIPQATLAGYDWGGRAACVVAALWPERVAGLVSCDPGYNIQDIAAAEFADTAQAFENPDFVDVVVHSYRHRFGLVAGDPRYAFIQQKLAQQPMISVPTVILAGADDGVASTRDSSAAIRGFAGTVRRQVIEGVGHNVPQEAPTEFVDAITSLLKNQ